jgi:hypothetical protein
MDGRTDMTKQIVAFRNFKNTPKNEGKIPAVPFSSGKSPASYGGDPGLTPGQSMEDLSWTTHYVDSFICEYSGFPLSLSFHQRPTLNDSLSQTLY